MTALTRRALAMGALGAAALPAFVARAQAPKIDTLRLFVPAAPGGGWDGTARVIEKVLRERNAVGAIQVENVAGAGGTVGLPRFVAMRGRRNTLMVSGLTLVSSAIANKSQLTALDTTPIARLSGETHVLVVPAESPLKTVKDFADAMRKDPQGTSVAGGSAGGTDHILLGMIGDKLGIEPSKLNYVAYSGGGPAVAAISGNHVKAGISNWSEFAPHVAAGKMRALGFSADERIAGVNVPTLREGGIDAVLYNWRAVFAPPGIPDDHRTELEALIEAMAKSPEWAKEAADRDWQRIYQPRAEFAAFLEKETKSIETILKRLGLAG
jgi:putative tricarboxylic transport membrane protein